MPRPTLYGSFPTCGREHIEEKTPFFTHFPSQSDDDYLLRKLNLRRGNTSNPGEEDGFNWSEQLRLRAETFMSQSQQPSISTSLSSRGKETSVLRKTSNNLVPMPLSLPDIQSKPGISDSPLSLGDKGVYHQMNDQSSPRMMQGLQHGGHEDEELIPTAIVIKNIPFSVKKEQLVALMSGMQLPLPYAFNYHFDNGVFRGLAFANFADPEETRHVICAMNHMELQGRKLRVEYKKMLPAEERNRIEREKREKREQRERAYSLPRHDHSPGLHRAGSTSELHRKRESVSTQSPKPGIYSGYAGSNHSSTSIRSYGSNNSYTGSIRLVRGIPDADSDNRFSALERRHSSVDNISNSDSLPYGVLSCRPFGDKIQRVQSLRVGLLERDHQTWEEFCVLQLVAFLQICKLEDVVTLTQSPTLLRERFKLYLKRMISQEGNMDFLSYQASPRPGQPKAQSQLPRHHMSIFSQSRSSIHSYSSRTSHSSASTASSFSSQISDGTLLNHVQQEAKSLKDCLINIQKKLKKLEIEPQGTHNNKSQEGLAAELATLTTLMETNETAIEWLQSREGDLGLLGFSDMSLLLAIFHREFMAVYKDLQSLKRQSKFQRVFRPGRSKQEVDEKHKKYFQIQQAVNKMMTETLAAFEAAETQKAAFIAAGKPYASVLILEAAADLGYAPHDTLAGSFLEKRKFVITSQLTHMVIKGTPGTEEPLDPRFRVQPSRSFRPGQVFGVLWFEPLEENARSDSATEVTAFLWEAGDGRSTKRVHSSIRRFVVVAADFGHCQCVPILTYHRQGTTKLGIKSEDHAIIYTGDEPPREIQEEAKLNLRPIRVIPRTPREQLHNLSCISYAKIYTVEHHVKVRLMGSVDPKFHHKLLADFKATWVKRQMRPVTSQATTS